MYSYCLAAITVLLFCATHSFAAGTQDCITVRTPEELSTTLATKLDVERSALIYARADWAINAVTKNDTYVPSIAFRHTINGITCIIVDATTFNGAEGAALFKQFEADGIPFFTLLNPMKERVATLKWGRDFLEFKTWFSTVKP